MGHILGDCPVTLHSRYLVRGNHTPCPPNVIHIATPSWCFLLSCHHRQLQPELFACRYFEVWFRPENPRVACQVLQGTSWSPSHDWCETDIFVTPPPWEAEQVSHSTPTQHPKKACALCSLASLILSSMCKAQGFRSHFAVSFFALLALVVQYLQWECGSSWYLMLYPLPFGIWAQPDQPSFIDIFIPFQLLWGSFEVERKPRRGNRWLV